MLSDTAVESTEDVSTFMVKENVTIRTLSI